MKLYKDNHDTTHVNTSDGYCDSEHHDHHDDDDHDDDDDNDDDESVIDVRKIYCVVIVAKQLSHSAASSARRPALPQSDRGTIPSKSMPQLRWLNRSNSMNATLLSLLFCLVALEG